MNETMLPSEEILLKYASGALEPGVRLLVDAHFEKLPEYRSRLTPFETVAGGLLASAPPAAMREDALARALAAIGRECPDESQQPLSFIDQLQLGGWRWAGPGAHVAPVILPEARTRLFLMRISPGRAMPEHGHLGREFTVVLEGSYRDEGGAVAPGAFIEQTPSDRHKPIVDSLVDCVCLFALEAPITVRGLAGVAARWAMR